MSSKSEQTQSVSETVRETVASDAAQPETTIPSRDKVVAFPTDVNIDIYPLTVDAWTLYTKRNGLGDTHCYRQFIARRDVVRLARALGRQVTVEELVMFAGPDGDKVVCSATSEEFQPIGFVVFTDKFFDRVSREKRVDISWAPLAGSFFVKRNPESEEILILSGHPYGWNERGEFLAKWTPMGKAHEANGHRWGETRARAEDIVTERKRVRKENDDREGRINTTLSSFFTTVKPAERTVGPRVKDDQNGRPDRRTFVPVRKPA